MDYKKIGHHYGKNKIIKISGLIIRSLELLPFVLKHKPVIALSHGSRSQLILTNLIGIPSALFSDYEFGAVLRMMIPTWFIVPEVYQDATFKQFPSEILKYPGIKEDVYVPQFKPDYNSIKNNIGIKNDKLLITIRPPAFEAHYQKPASKKLFEYVINYLGLRKNLRVVILPRDKKQEDWIRKRWPEINSDGKMLIPDHTVDGLNLMWHSDLVISGGGTMNREAAALGVPVYSIFRGEIGAVDRHLADAGRLTFLKSADDVRTKIALKHWQRPEKPENSNNVTLRSIVDSVVDIYEKIEHSQR
jgi:predicted glycosyltransferase